MKASSARIRSLFRDNPALRIAVIYAVLSGLWILLSDELLFLYFKEAAILTRIQILKGWLFIVLTALLLYFLLQREIVRFQDSEARALESERKLLTLMTNLPGMAYRRRNDEQWTMLFASRGSLALTGYEPAELVANRKVAYRNLIHAEDRQRMGGILEHALARGEGYQLTYRIRTAKGEERWVREQGVMVDGEGAGFPVLEGFVLDITAEKKAEESLSLSRSHLEELVLQRTHSLEQQIIKKRRAEKRFRDLLESAPDAMALVDSVGGIVLVNRRMEELFGYSRQELLTGTIETLIPRRYRKIHREHVKNFFSTSYRARPMGVGLDISAVAKNGREFPADISLSPLETREGKFVLADIRDITDRKAAETKIMKSYYFETTITAVLSIALESLSLEEQLSRILDAILAIPLLSLEKMGSIYLVDDEAPDYLVLTAHRGYGKQVLEECGRVPFGSCLCGKAAQTASTVFTDCLVKCHKCYDGVFPHGHYSVPVISGGKVLGILNIVLKEGHERDKQEEEFLAAIAATLAGIIEHRKTELEKERLQERLIESEKHSALGRMMAGVAHEIRNPLTALGGLTRRLDRKIAEGSREKEYTKVIIAESARLERILTSVLTYTREVRPRLEENDLLGIIDDSLSFFEAMLNLKLIRVRTSYGTVPPVLMGKKDGREVVDNILANAVAATPAGGGISIETREETDGERRYAVLAIKDTGTGIPAENLGMIFEPFFTTRPVGPGHGIGLGLSICRKIMEVYGGHIEAESRGGEGATFTLYFPAAGEGVGQGRPINPGSGLH